MELTEEQKQIIEETITNKPSIYGIEAVAGAGKSFTIFKAIDYIKEHEPNAKILYLVFNKANQISAEQKLMQYKLWQVPIEVQTAHSYALDKFIKARGLPKQVLCKLDKNIIHDICSTYRNTDIKYSKHAPFHWLHDEYTSSKATLKTFCDNMLERWDTYYEGNDGPTDIEILDKYGNTVSKYGIKVDNYSYVSKAHISAFKDIFEKHESEKYYTHSMYLKASAYFKNLKVEDYDYVFFDEAQDANYFMLKILERQNIKKLYFVGDERQSIYQFNSTAENVFKTKEFTKKYMLSKSFRFGDDIAKLATDILQLNSTHVVHGTEQTHECDENSYAMLYRTNATLFKDSLDLAYNSICNNIKLKIDLMRSQSEDSAYKELLAFLGLYYKYTNTAYYSQIKHYLPQETPASLVGLKAALENSLVPMHKRFFCVYNELYDFFNDDLHAILSYAKDDKLFIEKFEALRHCQNMADYDRKITMCTMHRSKGLEWDIVKIAEPTKLYYEDRQGTIRRNSNAIAELNLAYVACTRARHKLNAEILRNELSKEHYFFNNRNLILDDTQKLLVK